MPVRAARSASDSRGSRNENTLSSSSAFAAASTVYRVTGALFSRFIRRDGISYRELGVNRESDRRANPKIWTSTSSRLERLDRLALRRLGVLPAGADVYDPAHGVCWPARTIGGCDRRRASL